MIFEKLHLNIQYDALKQEFLNIQKKYQPIMTGPHFGGWSVTSSTGSYKDGWINGDHFNKETVTDKDQFISVLNKEKFTYLEDYKVPTEICGSQSLALIQTLEDIGLKPRRARFMLLKPQGVTSYHRDSPEDLYAVRLHIPIITNEKCFFVCEEGRVYLEENNAYLLKVNRLHKVENKSDFDRIHFICDVFDTRGVSQFHKWSQEEKEKLEKYIQVRKESQGI